MSDVEERELARALRSLGADAPSVPDLAQRARLGHRRWQIVQRTAVTAGALVLAGAGVAGCAAIRGGPEPAPRTVMFGPAESAHLAPAITRDMSFDAGALRITSPTAGVPAVGEAQAVSLFRSTGLPDELVQDVTIGYGEVTLNPDLAKGWHARAAWVVVYRDGPHGCPAIGASAVAAPEGRHVFILDFTSGTDALSYQEAGSRCGAPVSGPIVQPAQQYVSVPWTQVSREGESLTLQYRDQDCAGGPVTLTSLGTAEQSQVVVIVGRPMKAGQCQPGAEHISQMELTPGAAEPGHAPIGPVTGLYTSLQPHRFDVLTSHTTS